MGSGIHRQDGQRGFLRSSPFLLYQSREGGNETGEGLLWTVALLLPSGMPTLLMYIKQGTKLRGAHIFQGPRDCTATHSLCARKVPL